MADRGPLRLVTPLHGDRPSLRDMVGWLRLMADELEAKATENDVETLLILHVDADGELHSRCFGRNPPRAELVGLFQTAAIKTATKTWE